MSRCLGVLLDMSGGKCTSYSVKTHTRTVSQAGVPDTCAKTTKRTPILQFVSLIGGREI